MFRRFRTSLLPLMVLLALCDVSLFSTFAGDEAKQAAGLRLKGVDGKTYDVAEMRGEVVIVSFGATWCKPCEWELAAFEQLKQEFAGQSVRFFWVSVEGEEVPDQHLKNYAKSLKLTIPVLRDPSKAAFMQFSERVRLPMVVFFDKQGAFAPPRHTGMSSDPEDYKTFMRGRLKALLSAQAEVAPGGGPVTQ